MPRVCAQCRTSQQPLWTNLHAEGPDDIHSTYVATIFACLMTCGHGVGNDCDCTQSVWAWWFEASLAWCCRGSCCGRNLIDTKHSHSTMNSDKTFWPQRSSSKQTSVVETCHHCSLCYVNVFHANCVQKNNSNQMGVAQDKFRPCISFWGTKVPLLLLSDLTSCL